MIRAELLTRAQVAHLIGLPTGYVPAWARHHGVTAVTVSGQTLYRADDMPAAAQPPALRLARFIRSPLNHAAPLAHHLTTRRHR